MYSIAIDGPSGAGKSTIAKFLAKKLNITYLDTGAMYRAIGYYCHTRGINVATDIDKVIECLDGINVDIRYDTEKNQLIYVNNVDVSQAIREHYMSKIASDVSKIPEVREKLIAMQRKIAQGMNIVLDGRDITSIVLPNSKYKFYITASSEMRAKRRFEELTEKGQKVDYELVLKDIIDRDYNDMNRKVAPLVKTDDSVLIDTTKMSLSEVTEEIMKYIDEK